MLNTKETYFLSYDEIIHKSECMKKTISVSKKVADHNATIVITGESGTGKEMIARAIHFNSNRKNYPFIPINCSAVPDSLLESILFGYEEGSFTGAKKGGSMGKFEQANNGTIFLDEIGDMGLSMQAKILRVLDSGIIEKIGRYNPIPVDFRLISATNKEMHSLVDNGLFRNDLLYRINTIPIRIPSLKERVEDIIPLSEHFIKYISTISEIKEKILTDEVKDCLVSYLWPGNVRELMHAIEHGMIMSDTDYIELQDLPTRFWSAHRADDFKNKTQKISITKINTISYLEENEIKKAIDLYGSSRSGYIKASIDLGISLSTLYRKMKKYNI